MAGKGDYVVYDTDYDTYAAIYECQQLSSLMHRKSASILSRTPALDQTFVNRVRINRVNACVENGRGCAGQFLQFVHISE